MNRELKKPTTSITCSEINKYIYCPYQWYYSRLYDKNDIARVSKSTTHSSSGNFKRGLKFHKNYLLSYKLKRYIAALLFILALMLLAVILYRERELICGFFLK